jgi:predicted XRE-type DNA-binding protein
MTANHKTKRISKPLIKKLMAEANPIEKNKHTIKVAIACRIDDLIKERKYSQATFAKKVNKQPSEVSKWLSGTHNFTTDILSEIAFALEVPFSEIVAWKEKI